MNGSDAGCSVTDIRFSESTTGAAPRLAVLERVLKRERHARSNAERLLETRSRELYRAHRDLREEHARVQKKNTELERAHTVLQQTQARLVQSQQLASVGQLAAGVAHEINNPIAFIQSNLETLKSYAESIIRASDVVRSVLKTAATQVRRIDELMMLRSVVRRERLDMICGDLEPLIAESLHGTERVSQIVRGLKSFSRIDDTEFTAVDLHEGIDSTLKVIRSELNYKCDIRKCYGTLPPVECNLGKMNQVFMNLLINAGQAIEEGGVITIATKSEEGWVHISVTDNGVGIDERVIGSIFDPFFTTKPVGSGTGLGLSISYGIVEEHQGRLHVSSQRDVGSVFTVSLPIRQEA